MSLRSVDQQGRWRNKTVAFRMSLEEDRLLEQLVSATGLTKQDYIIHRLLNREIVVQGNPRVYKALRNQLSAVLVELQRIHTGQDIPENMLDLIGFMTQIIGGLKEEMNDV